MSVALRCPAICHLMAAVFLSVCAAPLYAQTPAAVASVREQVAADFATVLRDGIAYAGELEVVDFLYARGTWAEGPQARLI